MRPKTKIAVSYAWASHIGVWLQLAVPEREGTVVTAC
jgi:hypothetical protein